MPRRSCRDINSTLASQRTNNEAIVEDQGLGLSPLDLTSQLLVPWVYGGDGEINEVGAPTMEWGLPLKPLRSLFISTRYGATVRGRPARLVPAARPGPPRWRLPVVTASIGRMSLTRVIGLHPRHRRSAT